MHDLGVPAGPGGELVVRQDIGPFLIVAEVFDAKRRRMGEARPAGGGKPTVAGDDHAVLVDEQRI